MRAPLITAFCLAAACSAPADPQPVGGRASAIFAGGCFWCTESDFDHIPGVVATVSGYTGGRTANPDLQAGFSRRHRPLRGCSGDL